MRKTVIVGLITALGALLGLVLLADADEDGDALVRYLAEQADDQRACKSSPRHPCAG